MANLYECKEDLKDLFLYGDGHLRLVGEQLIAHLIDQWK